jgi:hypothetical protein
MNNLDLFEKLQEISKSQLEATRRKDLEKLDELNLVRRDLMLEIESEGGEEAWGPSAGRVREILFKILENDRKLKVSLLERMKRREEGLAEIRRRGHAEKVYRDL